LGCGWITALGCINGFENQIGHTRNGGNHHHNAVLPCGFADNICALAEAHCAADGRAAKFHHDQTLLHCGFSSFCKTPPSRSMRGAGPRVTPAPLLSAEVKRASDCMPSS